LKNVNKIEVVCYDKDVGFNQHPYHLIIHYLFSGVAIMSKVVVLTDSSAYLPTEIAKQHEIEVIPLTLIWEGKTYRDGVDIEAGEFYKEVEKASTLPTTSQVTVSEYKSFYNKTIEEGNELIVLPISSGISATYQSAVQAREECLDPAKIVVQDTRLVSMALGFQALTVARAVQDGATLADSKAVADKAYEHIGVYFTVDTLKYLHKGGRINSAKRLLGTALNVKPMLEIRDGKIELVSSVTSRRKALDRLMKLTEKGIDGRSPVRISVFHAGVEEEAKMFLERAEKEFAPVESILSAVSPVVGAHVGPGTMSIAFMAGM
jgi:DegV family protein with EDD domain